MEKEKIYNEEDLKQKLINDLMKKDFYTKEDVEIIKVLLQKKD